MLNNDLAAKIFGLLYDNIDGYEVSHQARRDLDNTSEVLYGELPFASWQQIILETKPKQDGVFFDLGSGTGRITMMSYIFCDFKKIVGIELLQGLHDKACEVKEIFNKNVKSQIQNHLENRELQLINKNIFDVDLSEADFIFMNHPFKDRDLFDQLEQKFLRELKSGTKIVTIIRALKDPAFKSLGSKKYEFSWGESTAFFHEIK